MSSFVATLKRNLAARDQATEVLVDLKRCGVRIADAIDTDRSLSLSDKEDLAVVLGGIAVVCDSIEVCLQVEGAGVDLNERGLLEQARQMIQKIEPAFLPPRG